MAFAFASKGFSERNLYQSERRSHRFLLAKNTYWRYFANLCSRTCMNKGFTLYGNISIYFPGVARCCICHFMSLQCFLHFSTFFYIWSQGSHIVWRLLWHSQEVVDELWPSAWVCFERLNTWDSWGWSGSAVQHQDRIVTWSHDSHMCGSHVWIRVGICWITLIISRSMCVGVPAVCVSFRLEGKDVFVFSLVLWHVDWYCRLDCLLPIGFIDADASFSSILLSSNLSKIWIYNKHWEAYVHFTVHHWSIYCMYIIMFPRFQTISKVLRPSFLSAFCEVCRCHQFCVRWLVGGVTWQWKQQKHEWTNVKNLGDILVSRHWCKILQALKIRHPRSTLLVHWLLHHFRVIKVSVYVFHIASGELNWEQHGASLAENPQRRQSEAASPMRRFQVQHLLGASTDPSELTLANLEKPESALGTVGAVSTMAAWHSLAACERMRGVSWSLSCDEPDDTKDICFFAFQS